MSGSKTEVKVIEKYHLSEQYTPKKLFDVYKESILTELNTYSRMEYSLLRKAECEFIEHDILLLRLEESIVAREKAQDLKRVLEKIFVERCGFSMEVRLEFVERKKEDRQEQEDQKIQMEVRRIVQNSSFIKDEEYSSPIIDKKEQKREPIKKEKKEQKKEVFKQPMEYPKKSKNFYKKSENKDVLFGRDFVEEPTPIEQIQTEMGELVIQGKIISFDLREIRGDKTILIFDVTDFTDTITVKMFAKNEMLDEVKPHINVGAFVKIKGVTAIDRFDGELTIASVVGIKRCGDFTEKRIDTSLNKRVELHCHTKMSDMDGVSDVKDIIKRAMDWGYSAIAITDHGDVQSFPTANHMVEKADFKVLYGMEGYLVDDIKEVVENSKNQGLMEEYVVFDIETTGFSPLNDRIIEIGAVKLVNGEITERFSEFVNPEVPIPFEIEKLTGIKDEMVLSAQKIEEVLPRFLEFSKNAVMVAHNAGFDMSFIYANAKRMNLSLKKTVVDTVGLARILLPDLNKYKLDVVAKALHISLENHHRAVDDAGATAEIFEAFIKMFIDKALQSLDEVNSLS